MPRLIGARTFDFSREVAAMAIVNRAPDSFFDNGFTLELRDAVVAAIVTSSKAKQKALSRVADVVVCGEERLDADVMLDAFAQRGLRQVLCEGGPTLFGTLLDADRVDELCLTISPLIEGGDARRIVLGAPEKTRHMTLHHVLVSGGTLMLRYLLPAAGLAP